MRRWLWLALLLMSIPRPARADATSALGAAWQFTVLVESAIPDLRYQLPTKTSDGGLVLSWPISFSLGEKGRFDANPVLFLEPQYSHPDRQVRLLTGARTFIGPALVEGSGVLTSQGAGLSLGAGLGWHDAEVGAIAIVFRHGFMAGGPSWSDVSLDIQFYWNILGERFG